ncbi:MAG TPA: hypothetical protein VFJ58_25095, partial [Armatimonadota bacterium]|nr:hypothetical protein [Armatimonadota bacterium]
VRMGAQVAHMAFISNGQLAVSDDASEHNWATIYDADTGTTGKRLKSTTYVDSLAASRDGKMVAIGGYFSTAQLWDTAAGHLIRALDTSFTKDEDGSGGEVDALEFGPNGRILVTAVPDGMEIWNIAAVRRVPPPPLARPFLTRRGAAAPTFATRGHLLATVGDGRIDMRDTRTWRRVRSLRSDAYPDDGGILAFSKDGRLLTCGGDGFLELWDVEAERLRFISPFRMAPSGARSFRRTGVRWPRAGTKSSRRSGAPEPAGCSTNSTGWIGPGVSHTRRMDAGSR